MKLFLAFGVLLALSYADAATTYLNSGRDCYVRTSEYYSVCSGTARSEDDKCIVERNAGQKVADDKFVSKLSSIRLQLNEVRRSINCSQANSTQAEIDCYKRIDNPNAPTLKSISSTATETANEHEMMTTYNNRTLVNCQNNVSAKMTQASEEIDSIIKNCIQTGTARPPVHEYCVRVNGTTTTAPSSTTASLSTDGVTSTPGPTQSSTPTSLPTPRTGTTAGPSNNRGEMDTERLNPQILF